MSERDPFEALDNDGLPMPRDDVGPWAEEKYLLLYNYVNTFATAMKKKWDQRVYIDLFAGAGRVKMRVTGKIVRSSPLLALEINDQFDRYIFCEKKTTLIHTLKKRVSIDYSEANVQYVEGDVNKRIDQVIEYIPRPSRTNKVLGFCFVDPYKMENLHFSTVTKLANFLIDFLILIPTHMDAARNLSSYYNTDNNTVEKYLSKPNWREEWDKVQLNNPDFKMFIADSIEQQMKSLGYLYGGLPESVIVRWKLRNLKLYLLGLYCRHELGEQFWKDAKKYSGDQQNLFE